MPTPQLTHADSYTRKVYLLAQFIHRPDPRFNFDWGTWEVIFWGENGYIVHFNSETSSIMALYEFFEIYNIEEICRWDRALVKARQIVYLGCHPTTKEEEVNWGRDGF